MLAGSSMFAQLATQGPVQGAIGGLLWMLPPLALGVLLARATARAIAGDDGVRVESFGRSRFVAYRDVDDFRIDSQRIALRLRDGSITWLRPVSISGSTLWPA